MVHNTQASYICLEGMLRSRLSSAALSVTEYRETRQRASEPGRLLNLPQREPRFPNVTSNVSEKQTSTQISAHGRVDQNPQVTECDRYSIP